MSQVNGGGGSGGGAITSVVGTANQIDVNTVGTTATVSIDPVMIAPGSIEATSSVKADTKFLAPNGAAGTPSYTFTADNTTGIFSRGASDFSIVIGGGEVFRVLNGPNQMQLGSVSILAFSYSIVSFLGGQVVGVTTPGAYPYTTLATDYVILVNTSVARTIIPLGSPTTGQTYRIKDNTGSAATNNITITPSGANIDGAASQVINTNYGSVDIVFNGTQWNRL